MPIHFQVDSAFAARVQRARLARSARRTLRAEKSRGDVTIVVTTDAKIRRLNKKFHATDAATDVLAFPSRTLGDHKGRPYVGDIIISYDTARKNARRAGWQIANELDLLVVHGILHLLGYADTSPRQRARMWQRQEKILQKRIRTMDGRRKTIYERR
ncbi:MAG: rRNA maturation RNase YbeY [Chloroflexi bacterium]|nr:rRNA maturation RNase YbeY [Chloroflexota bacterium]